MTTKEGTFDVDFKVVSPCDWLSSNPERVFHGKHTGKETFLEKVDPRFTGRITTSTMNIHYNTKYEFFACFQGGSQINILP